MSIQVNGRILELEKSVVTIADLLQSYNIQQKISVVEHNKEIINKSHYEQAKLSDGDTLEIVHFVGGG
ncbi:sulfur carrier protein ThiS [Halobacillus seohaensis]|uniref:Sulfur carrier protein ThiS n=1 Tax=Halobacillus seohaensis TaxID=447421 RepID=A0ABW2EIF0_9BACI